MRMYDFIFSERFFYRVLRHAVFWLVFLVYFYYTNLFPEKSEELWAAATWRKAFQLMIYFPISVVAVYVAIYFLLPRYILPGKYLQLTFLIVGLTIVYFLLAILLTMVLAQLIHVPYQNQPMTFKWFQPVRYGIGLPLTSAVLTTIIKLLKIWHLKQKEFENLQKQRINTELRLLRTQFQPHFLYDSLQHIYRLIKKQSSESPSALLKLSDILSYILYESEGRVSLEKELQVIATYLELQKTFYPGHLEIEINQQLNGEELSIEPLILVALVENCFENFQYPATKHLSLRIDVRSTESEINFQIECTDHPGNNWEEPLKRIEMLYPGRHSVDIRPDGISLTLERVAILNFEF